MRCDSPDAFGGRVYLLNQESKATNKTVAPRRNHFAQSSSSQSKRSGLVARLSSAYSGSSTAKERQQRTLFKVQRTIDFCSFSDDEDGGALDRELLDEDDLGEEERERNFFKDAEADKIDQMFCKSGGQSRKSASPAQIKEYNSAAQSSNENQRDNINITSSITTPSFLHSIKNLWRAHD